MRQHLFRLVAGLARHVCRALLRAAITGLVFAACLWVALNYMGVRLPDALELFDRFESVSRLSNILS